MRYLLVALLALASSAQAQIFERDGGDGLRRHRRVVCHCWRDEGWRDEERAGFWRRQRHYRQRWRHYEGDDDRSWLHRERREGYRVWRHRARYRTWRHHEREEGYQGWRRREKEEGYRGWRHPERDEVYRGWWRPEGGWREAESRDGPRRCRPPMHAAGDADARVETARNLAIKSWQEQVINEHGERFLNFGAAYIIDEHCDPARVGEGNLLDLKRCVVTAAPCLTPREADRPRGEDEGGRREGEHR
jgi:hypothetical protein